MNYVLGAYTRSRIAYDACKISIRTESDIIFQVNYRQFSSIYKNSGAMLFETEYKSVHLRRILFREPKYSQVWMLFASNSLRTIPRDACEIVDKLLFANSLHVYIHLIICVAIWWKSSLLISSWKIYTVLNARQLADKFDKNIFWYHIFRIA